MKWTLSLTLLAGLWLAGCAAPPGPATPERDVSTATPTPAEPRGAQRMPDALPPVRTDFDAAFFRLMQKENLFDLDEGAVEFLSPHLFRAPIALPANVPIGWYTATVYLFSGGVLLAKTTQDFSILKGGFEQAITDLAHQQPALYGLATVIVACFTGWLAGVAFRRD